jgi:hypothetical protein
MNEKFSLPHLHNGLEAPSLYRKGVVPTLLLGTFGLVIGISCAVLASTSLIFAPPLALAFLAPSSYGIYISTLCFSQAYNLATNTESTPQENLAGAMRAVRDFSRSSARVHVTDGTLEEILQNANELTFAANGAIPNAGAIKDVFESEFSPYRLAAQSFIKALPNNASAQEIITLANSYYNDDSRAT